MPRKKQDVKTKSDPNAGRKYYVAPDGAWGGYVDLTLDEDQRNRFGDWIEAQNGAWVNLLQDALAEGLGCSSKWDADNQCFVCSFVGAGVSNSNERYVLSARSDNYLEAMELLLYKHVELMRGDWGDYRPKTRTLKQWG